MDNLNRSGQNNLLETEDTNLITLLKNPQKFKETFNQMTNIASQALKDQQYDKALKALNKCTDMLDVLICIMGVVGQEYSQGYQQVLETLHKRQPCITWKMQKCNKFCEKAEEQLLKLLQFKDSKQNQLNLTKCLIRLRFQHCAILSQLNQHQKALELCKSTLGSLENYIRCIMQYAQSLSPNSTKSSNYATSSSKSSETVQFSRQVSKFAQQILKNLIKNLVQPLTLNNNKASFYYWQKNPENNEDQVKKKFVSNKSNDQCKRSILGVNKMTHWIDQFNIGTIMHMSLLTIKDFQNAPPVEQYLFKDKLYETVIYCSVAHFTIATQMRFIQSNKDKDNKADEKDKDKQKEKEKEKQKENVGDGPNLGSIIKKYGFKQKSQMFMMSELYHLRAIHIIAQNIKATVPYISHLIKSYDKHYIYKKQLEPVVAIDQQSIISTGDFTMFKTKQKQQMAERQQLEEDNNYYVGDSEGGNNNHHHGETNGHGGAMLTDELQPQSQELGYATARNAKITQSQQLNQNLQPLSSNVNNQLKRQKSRNKSQGKLTKKDQRRAKSRCDNRDVKEQTHAKPKKQKIGKQKPGKVAKQSAKQAKKRKNQEVQSQVRINHQSSTHIKVVVFKKKK